MKALLVAAPASGHGKTVVTQLIAHEMQQRQEPLSILKLGPDYIDPTHHQSYSCTPCFNIDTWAMSQDLISNLIHATKSSTLLIESAMGLFDGTLSEQGSAAAFCEQYHIPIVLVVDCRAIGATVAALVYGLVYYQSQLKFAGIVLNQVASKRHEHILKKALRPLPIPVIATIYRTSDFHIPSRHLGLVLASEQKMTPLEQTIDILPLFQPLQNLKSIGKDHCSCTAHHPLPPLGGHIAIAKDDAFAFIYSHILHFWYEAGATLSFFSPLKDEAPSRDADAVFLPGGYPELHLETLSRAQKFIEGMHHVQQKKGAIYAECGGFMVLGKAIISAKGKHYPMLGLLPHKTSFAKPKLSLSYHNLTLIKDSVLGKRGTTFKGHCFHYTSELHPPENAEPLFDTTNALLESTGQHGYQCHNVSGSYHHIIAEVPS